MELHIVDSGLGHPKAALIEPRTSGYIYVAAAMYPSAVPIVLPNKERARLLDRLRGLARELEKYPEVLRATVFRSVVRPPTARFSA